ncbi:MAG: dihydroneopterin aldolase [Caldilinea sp.]|nr:dihydroneopterin aldolase [Caldilinea sp.]MDW8442792.1 dihydroneopterin aldolase [Caldilineaceae bacterium]
MTSSSDRIFIKDLLVRGIVGIKPDERANRQDILINVILWADTRAAGLSDAIEDAVNYRTAAKAIIAHVESAAPQLVEKLAADLVRVCFETDPRIEAVELTVEKPGAVRFARSVGLTLYRTRAEAMGAESSKE